MFRRTRYFALGFVASPVLAITLMTVLYAFTEDDYVDLIIDSTREFMQS